MNDHLSLYAKRFFSGTFLSRISGMIRDLAMAFAFGDHPSVAAFMVAFRLSNLFRRLLGEGPLQSAFIPQFEEQRAEDPNKASFFFKKLSMLITIILIGLTGVFEMSFWILSSYGNLTANNLEILTLTAWLFPGLLFICLYGLNISLLQCHDCFFVPSFAPFICNVIWILGAFLLRYNSPDSAMLSLSKIVTIGFCAQWIFTLPLTLKHSSTNLKKWLNCLEIPTEIKTLFKSFTFGAVGVGAVQINAFIDALFARAADIRGPVYLWYSIRLEQLVLAIFGLACISAVIPRLSRAIKNKDFSTAQTCFDFSFKRIFVIMIPCSFAIFSLGGSAINLLYGRGQFLDSAIVQTTICLWSYTIGLFPSAMVILFSAFFYADNDFRTPTFISCSTIVLNIVLNFIFVFGLKLGAISTALATSISSWVNFLILQKICSKEGWKGHFAKNRLMHIVLASFCATTFSLIIEQLFFSSFAFTFITVQAAFFPKELWQQVFAFIIPLLSFASTIWLYAKIFNNQDLLEIFREFAPWKSKNVIEN